MTKSGKTILIVVLSTIGLCVVVCGGGAGLLFYLGYQASQSPENITVTVDHPVSVKKGETFIVEVHIDNTDSADQKLVGIDIYEDYLDGFILTSTNPGFNESSNAFGIRSLIYDHTIPANGRLTIQIELQAVNDGMWAGDLDVMVNGILSFTTYYIQTQVDP